MRVPNFSDIESEFLRRVQTMIWASAATIDTKGRPRSRILHPIWEGSTGWIATGRGTLKARHLDANPYLSLAYIADVMNPVYVDCRISWEDDPAERRRVWDLIKSHPEPYGFDPAHDFVSPDNPAFGLLKLAPWRIDLVSFPAPSFEEGTRVWSPANV